jgi:hypothetical protein
MAFDKKAYYREYNKRPEVREKQREYQRQRAQLPKEKARKRALYDRLRATPEGRARLRGYAEKHAPGHRSSTLKSRYGITAEQFDALEAKQGGRCATCGVIPKGRLHVDHCHSRDIVRGLLCGNCNRAIGMTFDNTSTLRQMIAYLEAHSA